VRQPEKVSLRPTIALTVLDCLARQLVDGLHVPRLDGGAETATPTAEALHVLREVEEVRTGARDLRQRLETRLPLRLIDTHRFGNGVVLLNYAAENR
jgi:hypothetical protein